MTTKPPGDAFCGTMLLSASLPHTVLLTLFLLLVLLGSATNARAQVSTQTPVAAQVAPTTTPPATQVVVTPAVTSVVPPSGASVVMNPQSVVMNPQLAAKLDTVTDIKDLTLENDKAVSPPWLRNVLLFFTRGGTEGRPDVQLEDYITLTVPRLKDRLTRDTKTKDDLRLYIDGLALPGIKPEVDLTAGRATFHLKRDSVTERFWQIFYRIPRKYEHSAHFGIGYPDQQIAVPFPANKPPLRLELVREKWLYFGLALTTLLWGFVIRRSTKNKLLRADWSDTPLVVPTDPAAPIVPTSEPPYSLAKVQLVYWLLLIASAYLLSYFVTGALPWLNASMLALLGLGITGKWAGKLIDLRQDQSGVKRHQDEPSRGFWTDILTDENGTSIARLQFVVFNLIIGFSFVRDVFKYWRLPEFDFQTMLLLTLSGAGYLALKSQENTAPIQHPTTSPAAATLPTSPVSSPVPVAAVDAEGTPSYRADEEDNAAPATPEALPAAPASSLAMG